jgi:hypothetical protein
MAIPNTGRREINAFNVINKRIPPPTKPAIVNFGFSAAAFCSFLSWFEKFKFIPPLLRCVCHVYNVDKWYLSTS